MFIDAHTLMNLPVYTESGTKLGLIKNIDLNTDTHQVHAYEVEPKFFGKNSYRVMPTQIKSITSDKVIVEDAVITTKETEKKVTPKTSTSLEGVIPSQEK